jgi:hypothetical protein
METSRAGQWTRSVVMMAAALACLVLITSAGTSEAGIQGSGYAYRMTAYGRITQFGSIFVNGVEYDTSAAQIRIDGQDGSQSQLRIGQVVTVKADVNADGTAGAASDVSFSSDVVGPLAQVDLAGGTLIVLGQKIRLLGDTLIDDRLHLGSLLGLLPGIMVQVSGFPNAAGEIEASRIDLVLGTPTVRLKGIVQDLDTAAQRFRLNDQTVTYQGIAPQGTLANGSTVSIQGSIPFGQSSVRATRVNVVSGLGGAAGERGQIEGLITVFAADSDFTVGLQRVVADADTQFILQGQSLGPDVTVDVRGEFNADGVLVARQIKVSPQGLLAALGMVESVSDNSVRVLGVDFATSDVTSFEDRSSQNLRPFAASALRVGDYVEIRGAAAGATVQATTLTRTNPRSDSYLEGTARELASPTLEVLGVRVLTTPQTRFPTGGLLAPLQFFGTAPGKIVRVHGSASGDGVIADRIELVK